MSDAFFARSDASPEVEDPNKTHTVAELGSPAERRMTVNPHLPVINEPKHGLLAILRSFPNESQREVITKMEAIWTEIGLSDAEREKRLKVFENIISQELSAILEKAYESQASYRRSLEDRVARYLQEIRTAEDLLNIQPSQEFLEAESGAEVFRREYILRARCNELLALRAEREKALEVMVLANEKYSRALGRPTFPLHHHNLRLRTENLEALQTVNAELEVQYTFLSNGMIGLRKELEELAFMLKEPLSGINWELLTEANIKFIKDRTSHLEQLKAERIATGKEVLQRIYHLCRRVELKSELLDAHPELESQLFDPEVLVQLTEERNRLEQLTKENLHAVTMHLRERICAMYEKTYASQSEKESFPGFESEEFTEALLDIHEAELNRLEEKLDTNRALYELLDEHLKLLHEKVEFEEKECDPKVMQNRGGILLKVQNEKKKVVAKISKVLADLNVVIEKNMTDCKPEMLVWDLPVSAFLQQRQQEMEKEKSDSVKDRRVKDQGSGVKRGKTQKETPTVKRLKNEVG
ncbi:hypothetical protein RvY_05717-2 [Ramazzottius varieornatus]|uniref:Uncharacterized protein n=1 Tax=Ramazzottius varieornatus TaxID=947166 RepID=A0A1D1UZL8_RAMVA|nr:hypothetical protein RvY_05717-2 [Ramazzottius varieornatus]